MNARKTITDPEVDNAIHHKLSSLHCASQQIRERYEEFITGRRLLVYSNDPLTPANQFDWLNKSSESPTKQKKS